MFHTVSARHSGSTKLSYTCTYGGPFFDPLKYFIMRTGGWASSFGFYCSTQQKYEGTPLSRLLYVGQASLRALLVPKMTSRRYQIFTTHPFDYKINTNGNKYTEKIRTCALFLK